MIRQIPSRFIFLMFAVFAVSAQDSGDGKRQRSEWTPDEMMRVKNVSGATVSPDGSRVAFVVTTAVMETEKSENRAQIYLAEVGGGNQIQLTGGEKSADNPQWSPDGKTIAFLSNRTGKNNIYLINASGGEARMLTDAATNVTKFKWSPDGEFIAFIAPDAATAGEEKSVREKTDWLTIDENLKMSRLFLVAVKTENGKAATARILTPASYSVANNLTGASFDWSPDGKTIAFTRTATQSANDFTTADISILTIETGAIRDFAATQAAESSPVFSPDGKSIAFVRSGNLPRWAENNTIFVAPASGDAAPRELNETFNRQPELVGWSADNRRIYFTETRGTTTGIFAVSASGGAAKTENVSTQNAVISDVSLNRSRTFFGFSMQNADRPVEAFASRAEKFQPAQISRANDFYQSIPLGKTETVKWKSADNLEIEGLLTFPVDYQPGKRYPLLLVVHGGPTGGFVQSFVGAPDGRYPIAVFAARGYAVLRANPRGSTGYGKDFRYGNYNDWGGKDYQDLMTGVDKVVEMGVADAGRLGVMGWSYGRFMTNWIVTQTKRFKAASSSAGLSNLASFTGTSDVPAFVPDYFGDAAENSALYIQRSPIFWAKNVTTPLLLQHGELDDRVPVSQAYEFYRAVKNRNVPTKMVVYPRSRHRFSEPKFVLDIMRQNVEWFDKYLKAAQSD